MKDSKKLESQIDALTREKRSILNALEVTAELINFQTSLNRMENLHVIFENTVSRIMAVLPLQASAFYLVNEDTADFTQTYCNPREYGTFIENELEALIEDYTFNWALGSNRPELVTSSDEEYRIILHAMVTPSRARGMFIGLIPNSDEEIGDISLMLLSVAVITAANAIESFELYSRLRSVNQKLEKNIFQLQRAEKELLTHKDNLESLVLERTKTLEESKRMYFLAAEAGGTGTFEIDPGKGTIRIDDSLKKMFPISEEAGEVLLDDWISRVPPEEQPNLRRVLYECIEKEAGGFTLEHHFVKSFGGGPQWFLMRGEWVVLSRGKPLILGTYTNITEKKQLEVQLHQSQKMEALGTMAGGIAHDFNNILSSILGYSELAYSDILEGGEGKESVKQVIIASKRARELVRQILSFTRQDDQEKGQVLMNTLISESEKLLRSTVPSSIAIESDVPEDTYTVQGNSVQIQQIIFNLCNNAVQAMEGSGTLSIRLKGKKVREEFTRGDSTVPPGNYALITVKDTGSGIPNDIISKIFDPFFTTKKPGKGSGMGLSVVHGIVKNHLGFITVESTEGAGTVFSVYLPLEGSRDEPKSEQKSSIGGGTERILLIDDEEMVADVTSKMLSRLGYQVTVALEGKKGLALFLEDPMAFDLVITDQTMPEISGKELAAEMLKKRGDLPIILLTGYNADISGMTASELGVKEILYKPVLQEELSSKVRKVFSRF
jgi:signal transduction histidine kinase